MLLQSFSLDVYSESGFDSGWACGEAALFDELNLVWLCADALIFSVLSTWNPNGDIAKLGDCSPHTEAMIAHGSVSAWPQLQVALFGCPQ